MFHPKAALLLGLVVLLVAESHSLPAELAGQQAVKDDFGDGELALSLIVNQMALLKILNESSTFGSLHDRDRLVMQDLKLKLDEKTRELKSELQDMKEGALNQLEDMKAATIKEINSRNEEAKEVLQEVKETAGNVSLQANTIMTYFRKCDNSWNNYQSSCYKVFKNHLNYDEATKSCWSQGAHLATIGTEGENSFVKSLITELTYIGLTDKEEEGVFVWEDGTPYYYTKWNSGRPNNYGGQDCVAMFAESGWDDVSCGALYHYICEKPTL